MKIKGHLKPLTLRLLIENNGITGSELIDKIEKRTGSKPSYGSIYPLLNNFEEKDWVNIEKEGRKKKYFLTNKGEKAFEEVEKSKEDILDSLMEVFRTYDTIFGKKDVNTIYNNIENIKSERSLNFPQLFDVIDGILRHEDMKEKKKKNKIRKKLTDIIRIIDKEKRK